jgi:hypothetical protein
VVPGSSIRSSTATPQVIAQVLARIDTTVGPVREQLRLWQYQSSDTRGALLAVSDPGPGSKRRSASQAANLRDQATVLNDWNSE